MHFEHYRTKWRSKYMGKSIDFIQPSEVAPIKEEIEELIPRTKNTLGVLFLIPIVTVVLVVLILPLIKILVRAFTDYNVIEVPKFIGFENFINLFSDDEVFQIALRNNFVIALFVTLIVGTLAFVISWLIRPAHKAVRYTIVLLFDLVSIFVLAGGISFLFSGDVYGFINSRLIEAGSIKEAIPFFSMYAQQIQLLIICLILFGPILSVLSLIKMRGVSGSKLMRLLFPLEHSLQIYLAGSLPILITPICWGAVMSAVGFPSTDYSAQTIIDHFIDYGSMRFQLGYASAISVVSFVFTVIFLIIFFVISFGIMHLIAFIRSEIALSKSTQHQQTQVKKISAYVISGVMIFIALVLLFPLLVLLMNSFKDLSEVFVFPPKIFPKKFDLQNYTNLFSMDIGNYRFSSWLFNMAVVPFLPAFIVTMVGGISAFGVGYFEYKARRALYLLILLCFVLLPTTILPDYANRFLSNNYLLLGLYAVFFSAAPLISFVYFKSVIERSRQYGYNLISAMVLNCIPVFFISYLMCYVNPFVNGFLYGKASFTIHFIFVPLGGNARIGISWAAISILTGIAFGVLLIAAITAMIFFPRKKNCKNEQ